MSYILILLAFLLGSVPFAYIIGRLVAKADIRKRGSGNVGTTNVLRTLGVIPAVLTLLGDAGKGVLAVYLAGLNGDLTVVALCGLAVVLGHCFTPLLRFQGGKGLATAAGVAIFLMPEGCLLLVILFVIIVGISRFVSLGAVVVTALLPFVALGFNYPAPYIWMSAGLALLVLVKHRKNIKRLRSGTEPRIGEKA